MKGLAVDLLASYTGCTLYFSKRTIFLFRHSVYEIPDKLSPLQGRALSGGIYAPGSDDILNPFGVDMAFIGLLFAVLASGCQSSDLATDDRKVMSEIYGL